MISRMTLKKMRDQAISSFKYSNAHLKENMIPVSMIIIEIINMIVKKALLGLN
jgi:hypothetical protein